MSSAPDSSPSSTCVTTSMAAAFGIFMPRIMSVSTGPGKTPCTLMFFPARDARITCVIEDAAALEAGVCPHVGRAGENQQRQDIDDGSPPIALDDGGERADGSEGSDVVRFQIARYKVERAVHRAPAQRHTGVIHQEGDVARRPGDFRDFGPFRDVHRMRDNAATVEGRDTFKGSEVARRGIHTPRASLEQAGHELPLIPRFEPVTSATEFSMIILPAYGFRFARRRALRSLLASRSTSKVSGSTTTP